MSHYVCRIFGHHVQEYLGQVYYCRRCGQILAVRHMKPDEHRHVYQVRWTITAKNSRKIVIGCKNCDFLREIGTP